LAAPIKCSTANCQAIYYAKNIVAAAAGTNGVTVTFNSAVSDIDLRPAEYAGLDRTNPLDVTTAATGSANTASSGSVTTTFGTELLVGAGQTSGSFTAAGSGFTKRVITSPNHNILEDRVVNTTGSYSATGAQSGTWTMTVVAFRAAGQ